MKHRLLLLIAAIAATAASAQAGTRTRREALAIAQAFFDTGPKAAPAIQSIDLGPDTAVFAFASDNGFAIIGASGSLPAVVAYSHTSSLDARRLPPALLEYVDAYSQYAAAVERGLIEPAATSRNKAAAVGPLLTTAWGQDYDFADLCPEKYPCGCVATAMAQIMYYHRWPATGTGSHTYTWNGSELSVDYSAATYDWDNMLTYYGNSDADATQTAAVATLCYHAGVSVDMNYTSQGSGAQSVKVPEALSEHFGYSKAAQSRRRSNYTSEQWTDIIAGQLAAGLPVYYSGNDGSAGGHAFVCDGMDADGKLHINWGWEGFGNGYFDMDFLAVDNVGTGGGSGNYTFAQNMITDIRPAGDDEADITRPVRLELKSALSVSESVSSVSATICNQNYFDFDGTVEAVLEGDALTATPIGSTGLSLGKQTYTSRTITISLPDDLADGTYRLYLRSRTNDYPAGTYDDMTSGTASAYYLTIVATSGSIVAQTPDFGASLRTATDVACTEMMSRMSYNITVGVANDGNACYEGSLKASLTPVDDDATRHDVGTVALALNDRAQAETSIAISLDGIAAGQYYVDIYYHDGSDYALLAPAAQRTVATVVDFEYSHSIVLAGKLDIPSQLTVGQTANWYIDYKNVCLESGKFSIVCKATNTATGVETSLFETSGIEASIGTQHYAGVRYTTPALTAGNYVVTAYWKEDDTEYLFYPESYNRVALSIANPTGMAAAGETGALVSIANGQITVSGIDGGTTATLTDISGRVVCRRQAQGHTSVSLPTHGLPQGIYVLKVGSLCRRIRL